jgi:hypothetical protein
MRQAQEHAVWAEARAQGASHLFGWLKPGDRFHFPRFPNTVYTKGKGGWYWRLNFGATTRLGKAYRTGRGTAVVKVHAGDVAVLDAQRLASTVLAQDTDFLIGLQQDIALELTKRRLQVPHRDGTPREEGR